MKSVGVLERKGIILLVQQGWEELRVGNTRVGDKGSWYEKLETSRNFRALLSCLSPCRWASGWDVAVKTLQEGESPPTAAARSSIALRKGQRAE